jgi:tetratricopeptide (TPR) repeat protein
MNTKRTPRGLFLGRAVLSALAARVLLAATCAATLAVIGPAVQLAAAAGRAPKDDSLEFLHLLQSSGYADVASDYLDEIKNDPSSHKEVMEVWDLEMAKCKKDAVAQKLYYNDAQAKQWTAESKTLLEKFIKEHPDLPEAITEAAKWLEDKAVEAQDDVQKSSFATDPAEKAKFIAEGRKIFQDIRPRFVDALKASTKLRDSMRPKTAEAKRQAAIFAVGENRLSVAMIDFYLADTQEAGAERTTALTKCIKEFDKIFQDFRESFLGMRSHFWHARTLQELGKVDEAKDIYEEVLAYDEHNIQGVDDNKTTARVRAAKITGREGFFADVEHYYVQLVYKHSQREYVEEVDNWRALHEANSKYCSGYQALTFDYAKVWLRFAEKAPDAAYKKKARKKALDLLTEIAKVRGPYQEDAVKLRRQLNPTSTPEESFEGLLIDGQSAANKKQWREAIELYEKALGATGAKKDKDLLARLKEAIVYCYGNLTEELYQQGKVDEAFATAKTPLKNSELRQTAAAPLLAHRLLFLLNCTYQNAPEDTEEQKKTKAKLLDELTKIAHGIIMNWPGKQEGDAARVVLLRLTLAQGKAAEADKILREFTAESSEYPNALAETGSWHWYKYKAAKKLGDSDKTLVARRDEDRKLAVDFISQAVKIVEEKWRIAGSSMPDSLIKTKMLLAEMYSEGNDFKMAVSLYKPLIDEISKDPSKPFDEVAVRIFYGAGPAYLKAGDPDGVADLGSKLIAAGPDQKDANAIILSFAMSVEQGRKEALTEGESTDPAVQAAAAAQLKTYSDLAEKMLTNLSKRKELDLRSMVTIVRILSNLGTDGGIAAAADLVDKIFDRADNDPKFDEQLKSSGSAVSLRALAARLRGERGEYDKAAEQIKPVLEKYPNALEPLMSQARILTLWASKDSSKYVDAVDKWEKLRKMLERAKPGAGRQVDPKYEVLLNEADCLFRMAQKTKNQQHAREGLNLLIPYFNLDPHIRAPGDEYKEVSVRFYQVGGKLAEVLGIQRPLRPPKVKTPPKTPAAKPAAVGAHWNQEETGPAAPVKQPAKPAAVGAAAK